LSKLSLQFLFRNLYNLTFALSVILNPTPTITLTHNTHIERSRRGRDRMVVGFKTTYAISASHY